MMDAYSSGVVDCVNYIRDELGFDFEDSDVFEVLLGGGK